MKTLVIIPSRLNARRLPRKPLLKINGKSIICHVFDKAISSKVGDVYVATGDKEIYNNVIKHGGNCIITKKKHTTGTDRIYEALMSLNHFKYDYILNIQGDEPLIKKTDIQKLVKIVKKNTLAMGTLACEFKSKELLNNKNIVKVHTEKKLNKNNFSTAKNFLRKSKSLKLKNIYHHIGIYMYKKKILSKFVKLKNTSNELKLKLEQLRALENKIQIHVVLSKYTPIGVDTLNDFIKVKKILERKK